MISSRRFVWSSTGDCAECWPREGGRWNNQHLSLTLLRCTSQPSHTQDTRIQRWGGCGFIIGRHYLDIYLDIYVSSYVSRYLPLSIRSRRLSSSQHCRFIRSRLQHCSRQWAAGLVKVNISQSTRNKTLHFTASLSAVFRSQKRTKLLHTSGSCPGDGSYYCWCIRFLTCTLLGYHIKLKDLQL